MSVHGPPRLYFEPLKLLNFNSNTDPDPAFNSNADPDTGSKNNVDQCGSATLEVKCRFIYVLSATRQRKHMVCREEGRKLCVCVPVWKNDSAGRSVWLKRSLSPLTRPSVDPVT